MSRLPTRWRLTLVFAIVMAIVLAATGAFVRDRVRSDLDAALNASLRSHAADVAALAQQSDTGLADTKPIPHGRQHPQLAQLIDAHRRVIDATAGLSRRPLVNTGVLDRAAAAGVIVDRTLVGRQATRLFAVSTRTQGQRLTIVVGQSLQQRDGAIRDLTAVLLLGGPAALLLTSVAGYFLAGAALRPVEAMRRRERRFIADASHELRTPLTMLRTELELIARDQPMGVELAEATASAIEETEHLRLLADDLLLLSRADHGRLELSTNTVDATNLVEAAVGRAQMTASAGLQVLGSVGEQVPPVRVDRQRVAQALGNLLDNAIRYATSSVELTARPGSSGVEFHVLDDGPGFPRGFLARAWERFSTGDTARADDGAGLGLSIVRTIAELHGGAVGATNRPTGGADVWITLPAATPDRSEGPGPRRKAAWLCDARPHSTRGLPASSA